MRHRKGNKKLSRATDQRLAMLRSIVSELLKHGRIEVTLTRGKQAARMADGVIELAKRGDLFSRRRAAIIVQNKSILKKVFAEAKARFGERKGGYTRLTKTGFRRGDAAPVAMLELV